MLLERAGSGAGDMDVAKLNSKCVSRNKDQNIFQDRTIACYTRERVKREEKEILQHQNTLFIYNLSTTLEPSSMFRCTIRILSHDLTHPSILPYRNNHAISSDVATPQTTSLSY